MDASKVASSSPYFITGLAALELGLIILAIVTFSGLIGTTDVANELTKSTLPVTITLGGIVLVHTCLWYLYFTYNPVSMNLYFLIATSMCMIISLTALGIAMVSRS